MDDKERDDIGEASMDLEKAARIHKVHEHTLAPPDPGNTIRKALQVK